MKQITNQEYKAYQEYKDALIRGRIITPDGLRLICASLDNDPEAIGKHFLTTLHRFDSEKANQYHQGTIELANNKFAHFWLTTGANGINNSAIVMLRIEIDGHVVAYYNNNWLLHPTVEALSAYKLILKTYG